MLARYVQKGDSIDYRPNEAIAAGDVVVLADLVGIARLDIAADTLGSLAVVGVFDVVKADGLIPSGSTVFWDIGANKATLVSASNHYLGKAIATAESGDETVRVLLNSPITSGGSSSTPAVGAIPNIVDNSGGSASDIIPALTDLGTRDAVASLSHKLNEVLTALRSYGILME